MAASVKRFAQNTLFLLAALLMVSGCAVVRSEAVVRIALLAPFEGRYREVGYNALYAARLALRDSGQTSIDLLPIDDGGTVDSAIDRAKALAQDPQVKIAIVLGYSATDADVQQAMGDIPVLIVGDWTDQAASDSIFILAARDLRDIIDVPGISVTDAAAVETPVSGGVVFGLAQFPKLRDSLDGITVVSSGSLPLAEFSERYAGDDPFAPEPGLLATLTYDATNLAISAVSTESSRQAIREMLANTSYDGLNGVIRFEDGYWADAPVLYYRYDENRQLVRDNGVVEQR